MLSPVLWRRAALFGFLAWLACVLYLALRPAPDEPGAIWDKALHFSAFYVLAVLGAAAFPRRTPWPLIVGLIVVGGGIEILQATPLIGRDGDWHDLLADTIGIGAALGPMLLPRIRGWLAGA